MLAVFPGTFDRNISYVEHLYAPLDSTIAVNRFIDQLKPSAMIIMETELWPNLLARLKKNNVPVILMNARLSDRSASRYSLLGKSFNKYIGDRLTMLICQTNDDRNNFEKLGISSDKLHISGSLKFDIDVNQEKIALGEQFSQRFAPRKILCVASTHEGEDEIALNIFQKVRENIPGLLLILIPRLISAIISSISLYCRHLLPLLSWYIRRSVIKTSLFTPEMFFIFLGTSCSHLFPKQYWIRPYPTILSPLNLRSICELKTTCIT